MIYEKSGTFYSAVKNEKQKLLGCLGGFFGSSIVFCTLALLALKAANQTIELSAVLLGFVIAAPACFFLRHMNSIMRGKAARYSCDDVKFTVTADGTTTTIYFTAITDITFTERTFLKLRRGYDVTIYTAERSYRFTIVFGGFNNLPEPKDTVFEPVLQWVRGLGAQHGSSLKSREPSLSSPDMSAPNAASAEEMPSIGGSLQSVLSRLDEELNAPEAPAAPPPAPITLPSPEQEQAAAEENPIIDMGTFFCEEIATWILRVFAVTTSVVGGVWVLSVLSLVGSSTYLDYAVAVFVLIIWAAFWITLFRFGNSGKEHSYRLRRTEMTISVRKKPEEVIYTRDLVRVEHRPMRFLWKQYGWKITVFTQYRQLRFRLLFPFGKKYLPYNKTVFAQLEKFCPAQTAEKENR